MYIRSSTSVRRHGKFHKNNELPIIPGKPGCTCTVGSIPRREWPQPCSCPCNNLMSSAEGPASNGTVRIALGLRLQPKAWCEEETRSNAELKNLLPCPSPPAQPNNISKCGSHIVIAEIILSEDNRGTNLREILPAIPRNLGDGCVFGQEEFHPVQITAAGRGCIWCLRRWDNMARTKKIARCTLRQLRACDKEFSMPVVVCTYNNRVQRPTK